MNLRTITNGRGETATTDGMNVWTGTDSDAETKSINALQPIETVFPPCAMSDADIRLNVIACDCLQGRAPRIVPNDDAENETFRNLWNTCLKIMTNCEVVDIAFSSELGVYARNVIIHHGEERKDRVIVFTEKRDNANVMTGCHPFFVFTGGKVGFPYSYLAAMQMAILAAGKYVRHALVNPLVMNPDGESVAMNDTCSDAALMIALRQRTPWFKNHLGDMPF